MNPADKSRMFELLSNKAEMNSPDPAITGVGSWLGSALLGGAPLGGSVIGGRKKYRMRRKLGKAMRKKHGGDLSEKQLEKLLEGFKSGIAAVIKEVGDLDDMDSRKIINEMEKIATSKYKEFLRETKDREASKLATIAVVKNLLFSALKRRNPEATKSELRDVAWDSAKRIVAMVMENNDPDNLVRELKEFSMGPPPAYPTGFGMSGGSDRKKNKWNVFLKKWYRDHPEEKNLTVGAKKASKEYERMHGSGRKKGRGYDSSDDEY